MDIPSQQLASVCSDEVLEKIPQYVGQRNRVHFGLEIGLQLSTIESIEESHRRDLFGQIKEMMHKAFNPSSIPVRNVAAALVCIGRGFTDFKDSLGQYRVDECEGWVSGF